MATRKKKRKAKKTYRFQLTLPGIIGIGVVCFCLFLWMFLFGIWAGQTILLPVGSARRQAVADRPPSSPAADGPVTLLPGEKKRAGQGQ